MLTEEGPNVNGLTNGLPRPKGVENGCLRTVDGSTEWQCLSALCLRRGWFINPYPVQRSISTPFSGRSPVQLCITCLFASRLSPPQSPVGPRDRGDPLQHQLGRCQKQNATQTFREPLVGPHEPPNSQAGALFGLSVFKNEGAFGMSGPTQRDRKLLFDRTLSQGVGESDW